MMWCPWASSIRSKICGFDFGMFENPFSEKIIFWAGAFLCAVVASMVDMGVWGPRKIPPPVPLPGKARGKDPRGVAPAGLQGQGGLASGENLGILWQIRPGRVRRWCSQLWLEMPCLTVKKSDKFILLQ